MWGGREGGCQEGLDRHVGISEERGVVLNLLWCLSVQRHPFEPALIRCAARHGESLHLLGAHHHLRLSGGALPPPSLQCQHAIHVLVGYMAWLACLIAGRRG